MPLGMEPWTAADNLRGPADNTTSAVIALLSLVAVLVLGYGLVRAIMLNRRPQIVLADMVAPSGHAELGEAAMLSSVVRQYVRRQIADQRTQITRIGKDILARASRELELQLDDADVDRQIQRSASDSTKTLLAALRAVSPDSADRFLGLFSAILPPPRGVSVSMTLIQRGTDTALGIGAAVEIVKLDGRPLASEVFWERLPVSTPGAQPGANERALRLLEPVTRWIAVRLLLDLMVSPRRRVTRRVCQGLQRLLAGGLFLQAMRDYPDQALTFGEQASAELEQACLLLPQISLPVATLAGVHERMGWAWQIDGERAQATDKFRAAVKLWQAAESITCGVADTADAKLVVLFEKRLFEVNRDGVSVRLPYVFCCWLRCVICAGGRGCRRCGPACAGLPGCGTRMPGGLRVWRAGSGSRRRRS